MPPVSGESPLNPALALDYLAELSTDIHAAVLLEEDGAVAAHTLDSAEPAERVAPLTLELFATADAAAAPDAAPVGQVEATTPEGGVYAVRRSSWLLVVISGRFALSSLMFYDLRSVLSDLGERAA